MLMDSGVTGRDSLSPEKANSHPAPPAAPTVFEHDPSQRARFTVAGVTLRLTRTTSLRPPPSPTSHLGGASCSRGRCGRQGKPTPNNCPISSCLHLQGQAWLTLARRVPVSHPLLLHLHLHTRFFMQVLALGATQQGVARVAIPDQGHAVWGDGQAALHAGPPGLQGEHRGQHTLLSGGIANKQAHKWRVSGTTRHIPGEGQVCELHEPASMQRKKRLTMIWGFRRLWALGVPWYPSRPCVCTVHH